VVRGGVDPGQAGVARVGRHPQPGQDHPAQVRRVEDDRRRLTTVVAEHLAAEGDENDPSQVEHVEHEQAAVEGGDFAEEAVVEEPEAADHGEAEDVGEQVLPLPPQRLSQAFTGQLVGDVDRQHQQRDRDRKDPVAEGDDPRELDLVPLPPLRLPLTAH
jgi:hypothetical protein